MIYIFIFFVTFFSGFLSAENKTQATEATVVTKCDDSVPGVTCSQKYQPKIRISDQTTPPKPQ